MRLTTLNKWRNRAFFEQGGLCFWCTRNMNPFASHGDPLKLTADHIKPKRLGGKNAPENIVAACLHCNQDRDRRADGKPRIRVPARFECV